MSHQITARALLSILVGKDHGTPLTLENIIEQCKEYRDEYAKHPEITTLAGANLDGPELTIATQLLASLDDMGYEIRKKPVFDSRPQPYGPR